MTARLGTGLGNLGLPLPPLRLSRGERSKAQVLKMPEGCTWGGPRTPPSLFLGGGLFPTPPPLVVKEDAVRSRASSWVVSQIPKSPNPQIPPASSHWDASGEKRPRSLPGWESGVGAHPCSRVPPAVGWGEPGVRVGRGEAGVWVGVVLSPSVHPSGPRATPGCSRTSGDGADSTEPVPRFFWWRKTQKGVIKIKSPVYRRRPSAAQPPLCHGAAPRPQTLPVPRSKGSGVVWGRVFCPPSPAMGSSGARPWLQARGLCWEQGQRAPVLPVTSWEEGGREAAATPNPPSTPKPN